MARTWLSPFGLGVRQNGQSGMPRFTAANSQPLHTFFMQHGLNMNCFESSGNGSWQIEQSSFCDLVRPFLMSASGLSAATHSSHRRMLCLSPRCSSLYESSGSSRSHAPQIFMMCRRWILSLQPSASVFVDLWRTTTRAAPPPSVCVPPASRLSAGAA